MLAAHPAPGTVPTEGARTRPWDVVAQSTTIPPVSTGAVHVLARQTVPLSALELAAEFANVLLAGGYLISSIQLLRRPLLIPPRSRQVRVDTVTVESIDAHRIPEA